MKKLRLLITKYCPKRCDGCCNKQWDLNNLPIVQHFNYDKIILTGGEPLSDQTIEKTICLLKYLNNIDINPQRKIYLYTADYDNLYNYLFILKLLNGITITLHNKKDGKVFFETQNKTPLNLLVNKNFSLRLNVFQNIEIPIFFNKNKWIIKNNIKWIDNCPLPKDEVFMRLKNID